MIARSAAVFFIALLLMLGPAMSRADTSSHGGVITRYSANSGAGTITITVKNPFGVAVSGYVDWSTSTQSGTVNFNSIPAYGSISITVTSSSGFGSSTAGAQVSDSTGLNTATGWGSSTPGSCLSCDNNE
jgi:hypothetical protein